MSPIEVVTLSLVHHPNRVQDSKKLNPKHEVESPDEVVTPIEVVIPYEAETPTDV